MIFALTLGVMLSGSAFAARGAAVQSVEDCLGRLNAELDLPPGWGFAPGEYLELKAHFEGLSATFDLVAQLAHFIDEPANLPFFKLLGAYWNAGFALEFFTDLPEPVTDSQEHRLLQVDSVLKLASGLGLYREDFSPGERTFFANVLGHLPPCEPITSAHLNAALTNHHGTLTKFTAKYANELPSMREMVLHSQAARRAVIETVLAVQNITDRGLLAAVASRIDARLRGVPDHPPAPVARQLDLIEALMARNISRFVTLMGKQSRGNAGRTALKNLEPAYLRSSFQFLLQTAAIYLGELPRHGPMKTRLTSPFILLGQLEHVLSADTQIDQGHAPVLRRLFAEVLLGQPTLSGRQVQQLARGRLERTVRKWRLIWRDIRRWDRAPAPAPARDPEPRSAPAPSVMTREERLREYATRLREPAGELGPPAAPAPRTGVVVPLTPPEPDVWDELEDQRVSSAEARARFRELIPRRTPVELRVRRTGFRYRVSFSDRVIDRLLSPLNTDPEDIREWIKALRLGPARPRMQRGWKKLTVPIDRIYDWEIKPVKKFPLRMLGYKTGDGAWHFDTIDRTH